MSAKKDAPPKFSHSEIRAGFQIFRDMAKAVSQLDDVLDSVDAALLKRNMALDEKNEIEKEASGIIAQAKENVAKSEAALKKAQEQADTIVNDAKLLAEDTANKILADSKQEQGELESVIAKMKQTKNKLSDEIKDLEDQKITLGNQIAEDNATLKKLDARMEGIRRLVVKE